MELADLTTILESDLRAYETDLEDDDYTNGINMAIYELWALPVTSSFQIMWMQKRAKRHVLFNLATGSSRKAQIKSFKLDQRFKHLMELVKILDEEFKDEQAAHPEMFPAMIPSDVASHSLFGTKIDAGFQYDQLGRDTTYTEFNQVELSPDETDA